jgi:hypothetical protein
VPLQLIKRFQKTWSASSKACFNRVRESMERLLIDVVKDHFARYDSLQIYLRLAVVISGNPSLTFFYYRSLVSELVHHHERSCIQLLEMILEMEETPFTLNTHYLETCTDQWLSRYRDAKAGKRVVGLEQKQQLPIARSDAPPSGRNKLLQLSVFAQSSVCVDSSPPPPFTFDTSTFIGVSSGSLTIEMPSLGKSNAPRPPALGGGGSAKGPLLPPNTSPFASFNLMVPKALSSSQVNPAKVRSALSVSAEIGYGGLVENLGELSAADEYEMELRVMAGVRGYFQVTSKVLYYLLLFLGDNDFFFARES